ncbi:hypothetical protein AA313_de0205962 [Arthrobotrys entomopaga]|nr:hypothetical protein AA313_de0205962 [Arthrobotrys entomopaga]
MTIPGTSTLILFVPITVEKNGKQKKRWSLGARGGKRYHFIDKTKEDSQSEKPSDTGRKRKLGDTDFTVVKVEKRDGDIKRWLVTAKNPTCSQASGKRSFFLDYSNEGPEPKRPKAYLPKCHDGKCTATDCIAKSTLLALFEAPRK